MIVLRQLTSIKDQNRQNVKIGLLITHRNVFHKWQTDRHTERITAVSAEILSRRQWQGVGARWVMNRFPSLPINQSPDESTAQPIMPLKGTPLWRIQPSCFTILFMTDTISVLLVPVATPSVRLRKNEYLFSKKRKKSLSLSLSFLQWEAIWCVPVAQLWFWCLWSLMRQNQWTLKNKSLKPVVCASCLSSLSALSGLCWSVVIVTWIFPAWHWNSAFFLAESRKNRARMRRGRVWKAYNSFGEMGSLKSK